MIVGTLQEKIKHKARQLGFTLAGITSPGLAQSFPQFQEWIDAGKHAGMEYLARPEALERRRDSTLILPGAKSVIVLGYPYYAQLLDEKLEEEDENGRIASYAWGKDYHDVIPEKLKVLVEFIQQNTDELLEFKIYTDTGPILEKEMAVRAGLGWIGKNSCLVNPFHGSYFFLSEIFINLDLLEPVEMISDHCGSCHRCVDACPTHCIEPNRTIDAVRCISYQTIENKFGIDEYVGEKAGSWVFGCDRCQQVCPWNLRFSNTKAAADLCVPQNSGRINLLSELNITAIEFNKRFKDSPIKRAKRRGYLRNIINALANTGTLKTIEELEALRDHDEELVRFTAERAIQRIRKRMVLE